MTKRSFLFVYLAIFILCTSSLVYADGSVSIKIESISLSQPDSILKSRLISGVSELADYIKQIEASLIESFKLSKELKATTGAVVVAVKSGYRAKPWLMSSEYPVPILISEDFQKRFQNIRPVIVQGGPVAFAIHFTVNGGGRPLTQGDNPMPMPQEWAEASKKANIPLLVPDGILSVVWPDDVTQPEPSITVPDGFELQLLDITYGSIAKPQGWFYRYSTDKNSIVWTISKEDPKLGGYLTGLRIQFIPSVSKNAKRDPEEIANAFISQKRESAKVLKECSPKPDGTLIRSCLETTENIKTVSGQVNFHILYSVFWSKEQDTFVLTTFGTPDAEWENVRRIVDVMANFKLLGKDFWKNIKTENK